jgi:hypothetical protein
MRMMVSNCPFGLLSTLRLFGGKHIQYDMGYQVIAIHKHDFLYFWMGQDVNGIYNGP